MEEITIRIPDDCDLHTALLHLQGCFNQSQNDYKRIEEGRMNGVAITFGNGRSAYFYKTKRGYVLQLLEMDK